MAYGEHRRMVQAIDGYTIRQIMDILPLSYAYIIDLIKTGRLPAVKRGRSYIVAKTDLQAFIAESKLWLPKSIGHTEKDDTAFSFRKIKEKKEGGR